MEVVCSCSFQGERNAKHIPLDSKMNKYRLKEKISLQAYKFRPGICQFCIKRLIHYAMFWDTNLVESEA